VSSTAIFLRSYGKSSPNNILILASQIVCQTSPLQKSLIQEFMDFLQKFGIIGLAIAFVIGAAASKLVTALVSDIITPLVGLALQETGDLKTLTFSVGKSTFLYGDLIANIIDFLIIAFIVFILYKQLSRFKLVEDKSK
jgi:large conductance mechanosensitive channel